jgi:hypothetical protein
MNGGVSYGLGVALRAGAIPLVLGLRWARKKAQLNDTGIPVPRWDLRLAAKAALDEAFFATELISATIVSLRDHGRVKREVSGAVEFYEARGWIDKPARFHTPPPPPEAVGVEEASSLWGSYRHLRFDSGYEPHPGEPGRDRWLDRKANRTAHAWLLEHPGPPRPWLVCVPGYRMGHPAVDFTGFRARWLHRTLGLNVAIPVLPLHGPRCEGRRGGDGFLTGDFVDTVHAQTQAVWDIRRLLHWLRCQRAPGVGIHGVSLGAYTTALLAGLEDDLDCVIAGIPAADFLRLIRNHLPPVVLHLAAHLEFPFEAIERMLRVISPLAIPPRVPRERRYLYAGVADRLASPDHARDLWHHWERPRLAWYEGGHVSFVWEAKVEKLLREALYACGLWGGRAAEGLTCPGYSSPSPSSVLALR